MAKKMPKLILTKIICILAFNHSTILFQTKGEVLISHHVLLPQFPADISESRGYIYSEKSSRAPKQCNSAALDRIVSHGNGRYDRYGGLSDH